MLSNGIKNKRKNRFINILDEEENLTPYKRYDFNAKKNVKNKHLNLILKQTAYSSFNRKVIVPMIILLIIIFFLH